jgi:hypothetical protein
LLTHQVGHGDRFPCVLDPGEVDGAARKHVEGNLAILAVGFEARLGIKKQKLEYVSFVFNVFKNITLRMMQLRKCPDFFANSMLLSRKSPGLIAALCFSRIMSTSMLFKFVTQLTVIVDM